MGISNLSPCLVYGLMGLCGFLSVSHSLTLDYYAKTCPTVLQVVRKEMECAVLSDPRNAAFVVRLHFHDCFVQVLLLFLFTFVLLSSL